MEEPLSESVRAWLTSVVVCRRRLDLRELDELRCIIAAGAGAAELLGSTRWISRTFPKCVFVRCPVCHLPLRSRSQANIAFFLCEKTSTICTPSTKRLFSSMVFRSFATFLTLPHPTTSTTFNVETLNPVRLLPEWTRGGLPVLVPLLDKETDAVLARGREEGTGTLFFFRQSSMMALRARLGTSMRDAIGMRVMGDC